MSSRERDVKLKPGAAEVAEGDQGLWAVEAEAAVADEPDVTVEAFESAVGSTRRMRLIPRS